MDTKKDTNSMSTRFELKGYVDKRGLSQIRLVKQSGQKKRRFSTNLKVEPKYFQNKHNHWIKRSHPNCIYLNNVLTKFYEQHKEIDPRTGPITLDQGFTLYLEHVMQSDRVAGTKVNIQIALEEMRSYFDSVSLLHKPIISLSNKSVRSYFDYGLTKGRKNTTMRGRVKNLVACINYLVGDLEVIPHNPIQSLRLKNVKQEPKKTPSFDEVLEFLSYKPTTPSEELAKDVWLFAFYAKGLRIVDVYKLKTEALDYTKKEFLVRQQKTGEMVAIPLIEPLLDLIAKYQNDSEYIFDFKQDESDHRDVDRVAARLRKGLRSICSHSNIKRITGMHDARHAFGMLARMSRASIPEIQHALGHSNPGVTATYIRQISPENQFEWVNEIFNQLANDRRKAGD